LEVRYQNETYRNVIASLPGNGGASGEVVVVGAHYDSSSPDPAMAPRAYNGCGVAIVLELARVMSRHEFNRTIEFAFWNRGEDGALASADYVAEALGRSQVIPLYLNFDCPGYEPDNRSELDIIHNANAATIAGATSGHNSAYGIDFNLIFNEYSCVSDHRPFWRGGYPAIWFHAHSHNPDENSPNDTISTSPSAMQGRTRSSGP
jgi:Zn-dependent M28 family amino/carboxypeptidase